MSNVTGLRCIHCEKVYSAEAAEYFCPACGYGDGILDVLYDYEAAGKQLSRATLGANADRSIWRYLPLLPVENHRILPHLQVGWTPLYEVSPLAASLGVAQFGEE